MPAGVRPAGQRGRAGRPAPPTRATDARRTAPLPAGDPFCHRWPTGFV